jgi:TonB family protein
MRLVLLMGATLAVTCGCAAHATSSTAAAGALDVPQLVTPQEGAVLTFFPRTIDFEWRAVPGAATYGIEVDCYHCCATDQWCSDVNPRAVPRHQVAATKFTTEFPGNQPGRWRVWAIDGAGRPGPRTPWREFTFYQQTRTAAAPPSSFQDPTTGQMLSGPGVVGPHAVYSPAANYPQSALKDRITGEVTLSAVVDENGRVQAVTVRRSLRADLDDTAIATLKTWRFEPARKDGRAMAARIDVTMTFTLR